MKKWTKVLSAFVVATVMSAGMAAAVGCDGCGDDGDKHEHTYATDWTIESDGHWKECTCGDKIGGDHEDELINGTETAGHDELCDVCGYNMHVAPEGKVIVTFYDGTSKLSDAEIDKGGTVPKPADPQKDGHKFEGWYADAACKTPFDFTQVINANTPVYAKLTPNADIPVTKVTVSFDTHGGNAIDPVELDKGGKVTAPAKPTQDGQIFDGWFKDAEYKTSFDFNSPVNEDITLHARWREVSADSIFDVLSTRKDNIISEDFLATTTDSLKEHGGTYGNKGVYVSGENGLVSGDYKVEGGKLIIGSGTKVSGHNVYSVVDFGIVSGTVEGYFEYQFNAEASGNGNKVVFYNQGSKVLEITANGKTTAAKFVYNINGVAATPETEIKSNMNTLFKVEFKFDLENKKLTLKINGEAVFTDKEADISAITGFRFETSDGGARKNTISNIAVCGTEVALAAYKTDLAAKLDAKLAAMTDEENGTHLINKADVIAACVKTDLEAAEDHVAAYNAYNEVVKAMDAIANDAQANAIAAINTAYPAANYTVNKDKYDAQIAKILAEKDAEKLAESGETLTAVLAAIDAIDNDKACYKVYMQAQMAAIMTEYKEADYKIKASEYVAAFEVEIKDDYSKYDSYQAAIDDLDAAVIQIKDTLSKLATDAAVIEAYANEHKSEISDHKNAEIEALTDEALKTSINTYKTNAVAALTNGVIEAEGYADAESDNYYITVINGKIAAAQAEIVKKLSVSTMTPAQAKKQAEDEFAAHVENSLAPIKVNDPEWGNKLDGGTEATDAPALDFTDCVEAGDFTAECDAKIAAYTEWLQGKIDNKKYTITLHYGSKTKTVEVNYDKTLALPEEDPTANEDNLMIEGELKLYNEAACTTDYNHATKVYADNDLYYNAVAAVTVDRKDSYSYNAIDKTGFETRTPTDASKTAPDTVPLLQSDFNDTANSFMTIVEGEGNYVAYRVGQGDSVELRNEALQITIVSGGTLSIQVSSTGSNNWSSLAIKDAKGNYIEKASCDASGSNVKENGSVYGFKTTTKVTYTFKLEAGTYTICTLKAVGTEATDRNTRVYALSVTEKYKEKANAVTGVSITNENVSVKVDKTAKLEYALTAANSEKAPNNVAKIEWSVNEAGAEYVEINKNTGVIKGLKATPEEDNPVVITVTVTDNDGETYTGTITVAIVDVLLESVSIKHDGNVVAEDAAAIEVTVKDSITLEYVLNPEEPTNVTDVVWSVAEADQKYVTVDENGVVTAVSAGNNIVVTVTAHLRDGGTKTATVKITVPAIAATGISIDETANVGEGQKVTLTPVVTPVGASVYDVEWSSSDTSKATVADGVVTGVAAGEVTITATLKVDGETVGEPAECVVTVVEITTVPDSIDMTSDTNANSGHRLDYTSDEGYFTVTSPDNYKYVAEGALGSNFMQATGNGRSIVVTAGANVSSITITIKVGLCGGSGLNSTASATVTNADNTTETITSTAADNYICTLEVTLTAGQKITIKGDKVLCLVSATAVVTPKA